VNPRNLQQVGKKFKRIFQKNKSAKGELGLPGQVKDQRLQARVGLNPFDLPWSGQERLAIALILGKTSPSLPKELRSAIIDFASKPKFLKDFGIDLDTAREVERAINHAPGLKSAMDQFPSIVKGLLNGDVAREHFRSIAHKIPSSPDALAVLKQCVETDTGAILDATTRTDQFKAATQFMGRLAAFGIKTN
jgi:hypothetical protein